MSAIKQNGSRGIHVKLSSVSKNAMNYWNKDGLCLYVQTQRAKQTQGIWTPDELLLAAICGSYMSVFFQCTEKLGFNVSNVECDAIRKFARFGATQGASKIEIYSKIFIPYEGLREKAEKADKIARRHSYQFNFPDSFIEYRTQVFVGENTMVSDYSSK